MKNSNYYKIVDRVTDEVIFACNDEEALETLFQVVSIERYNSVEIDKEEYQELISKTTQVTML